MFTLLGIRVPINSNGEYQRKCVPSASVYDQSSKQGSSQI